MDGVTKQVLTIIGLLQGIRTEELASIMIVPPEYIEEVCQSLLDDDLIIRTPYRAGFALKGQARNELLETVKEPASKIAVIEQQLQGLGIEKDRLIMESGKAIEQIVALEEQEDGNASAEGLYQ